MTKNIEQAMNWRAAIKLFDPQKKLSDQQLQTLLECLRLSASSFGLQPWKFLVVENPALRAKLREKSWNQSQITDASHLIVFCRIEAMTDDHIAKYLAHTALTRQVPKESLEGYAKVIKGFVANQTPEQQAVWMEKQVYIALGTLLTAAAHEGIDTCPMEGFDKNEYDSLLGLREKGLRSCVVCAIGFRHADDPYSTAKKVRFDSADVIQHYI